MTLILAPAVIQVAGVVIVGAVFIQSVFLIVSSFRRLTIEREQRRVTLDSLRYQTEIATAEVWRPALLSSITLSRIFAVKVSVPSVTAPATVTPL